MNSDVPLRLERDELIDLWFRTADVPSRRSAAKATVKKICQNSILVPWLVEQYGEEVVALGLKPAGMVAHSVELRDGFTRMLDEVAAPVLRLLHEWADALWEALGPVFEGAACVPMFRDKVRDNLMKPLKAHLLPLPATRQAFDELCDARELPPALRVQALTHVLTTSREFFLETPPEEVPAKELDLLVANLDRLAAELGLRIVLPPRTAAIETQARRLLDAAVDVVWQTRPKLRDMVGAAYPEVLDRIIDQLRTGQWVDAEKQLIRYSYWRGKDMVCDDRKVRPLSEDQAERIVAPGLLGRNGSDRVRAILHRVEAALLGQQQESPPEREWRYAVALRVVQLPEYHLDLILENQIRGIGDRQGRRALLEVITRCLLDMPELGPPQSSATARALVSDTLLAALHEALRQHDDYE